MNPFAVACEAAPVENEKLEKDVRRVGVALQNREMRGERRLAETEEPRRVTSRSQLPKGTLTKGIVFSRRVWYVCKISESNQISNQIKRDWTLQECVKASAC